MELIQCFLINICRFWLTLLTDALPLLEHPNKVGITGLRHINIICCDAVQTVFSQEQTLEMVKCINALEETKFHVNWLSL